jgi:hypothetical protein
MLLFFYDQTRMHEFKIIEFPTKIKEFSSTEIIHNKSKIIKFSSYRNIKIKEFAQYSKIKEFSNQNKIK